MGAMELMVYQVYLDCKECLDQEVTLEFLEKRVTRVKLPSTKVSTQKVKRENKVLPADLEIRVFLVSKVHEVPKEIGDSMEHLA